MSKTPKVTVPKAVLSNIIAAVLAGVVKDKDSDIAKKAIGQNLSESGELTVKIPYIITKGEDYDCAPTVSILSKAVLAKALVYSGITAPAFLAALGKAATEALQAGDKVADTLTAEDQRVLDQIEVMQAQVIAKLPRQPRTGVVKVNITTDDKLPIIVSHTISA